MKIGITKKRKKQSQQSRKEKVAKMDDGNETTDNELDYEEEVESEEEEIDKDKMKLEEEKKVWSTSGWKIDPRPDYAYKPKLTMEGSQNILNEIGYFLHFFPTNFLKETMLPAIDTFVKEPVTFEEFLCFLGLFNSMEVQHLPERRMYWDTQDNGIFQTFNYGKYMSRARFEEILSNLTFSPKEDKDDQILDYLDAVNKCFQAALRAGDSLCLDESMVKAFHRNLKGKMKIIRKPRPIGNEFKTLCDARSKIVLYAELYEGKEIMQYKDYVDDFGATTACCLRLTDPWKGTGRLVIGDSWFGSVNSVAELMNKNGLFAIMLVKTAHKNYPRLALRENPLKERGQWKSLAGNIKDVKMMAVLFKDLKEKQFISSCSTDLEGEPRITRHHGNISRPKVAETYLKLAAGIDIHNHVRTGSVGLEDVWRTKEYVHRQFAGITGFIFTNAYLAI